MTVREAPEKEHPIEAELLLEMYLGGAIEDLAAADLDRRWVAAGTGMTSATFQAIENLKLRGHVRPIDNADGKLWTLSRSGSRRIERLARAILQARFLLGLRPHPEPDAALHDLLEHGSIASALLLTHAFSGGGSVGPSVLRFLGAPEDEDTAALLYELKKRRLLTSAGVPTSHEEFWDVTPAGRALCESWLKGQDGLPWPLSLVPRHTPSAPAVFPRELGLRDLSSSELVQVARSFVERRLDGRLAASIDGPDDGGRDVDAISALVDGHRIVIQCKATTSQTLGPAVVRREKRRDAPRWARDCGLYLVVTNARATAAAHQAVEELAADMSVPQGRLIGRDELEAFLREPANHDVALQVLPHLHPHVSKAARAPLRQRNPGGWASHLIGPFLQEYRESKMVALIDVTNLEGQHLVGEVRPRRSWHAVDCGFAVVKAVGDSALIVDIDDGPPVTLPIQNCVLLEAPDPSSRRDVPRLHVVRPEDFRRS